MRSNQRSLAGHRDEFGIADDSEAAISYQVFCSVVVHQLWTRHENKIGLGDAGVESRRTVAGPVLRKDYVNVWRHPLKQLGAGDASYNQGLQIWTVSGA